MGRPSHATPTRRAAFTLVELLVVVAILSLLAALLAPSLGRVTALAIQVDCMSQLKQVAYGHRLYSGEYEGVLAAHKQRGSGMSADGSRPDFWATDIQRYTPGKEVFRCPGIREVEYIAGTPWTWHFGPHRLGYGYNAYFLGVYSHTDKIDWTPALQPWMSTKRWRKISEIKSPAMCLMVADTNPIPPGNWWASSMWWPKSGAPWWEGVNAMRHLDRGAMVFNDAHGETRISEDINPLSSPKETGDDHNVEFWDPLQRDNPAF